MNIPHKHKITTIIALVLVTFIPLLADASNPIRKENKKPGASDWQLTRVRTDGNNFRSPWVEGYCSKQSVMAGETIDIMVSTDPPRKLEIEIFRTGY